MNTAGKYLITAGSDDPKPGVATSLEAAEAACRARSLETYHRTAYVNKDGRWLMTYIDGKLAKCDLDACS